MPLIPYLPMLDSKSYNSNGKIVKEVERSVRPETNRTLKAFSQCGRYILVEGSQRLYRLDVRHVY